MRIILLLYISFFWKIEQIEKKYRDIVTFYKNPTRSKVIQINWNFTTLGILLYPETRLNFNRSKLWQCIVSRIGSIGCPMHIRWKFEYAFQDKRTVDEYCTSNCSEIQANRDCPGDLSRAERNLSVDILNPGRSQTRLVRLVKPEVSLVERRWTLLREWASGHIYMCPHVTYARTDIHTRTQKRTRYLMLHRKAC